jgi:hypothetical protein
MKTKSFLGIVLSVALAMVTFGGCADDTWGGQNCVAPVDIWVSDNSDLRGAIADEVNVSRAMSAAEHRANGNRKYHRVSEITEFYFPTVEIDGFELYSVAIFDSALVYIYASIERDNDFGIGIGGDKGIIISMGRPEWYEAYGITDHFSDEARDAHKEGWGYLTESGMIYAPNFSNIVARLGDTSVRIDVPQELNTYEFLRDLALRVIETMELVTV